MRIVCLLFGMGIAAVAQPVDQRTSDTGYVLAQTVFAANGEDARQQSLELLNAACPGRAGIGSALTQYWGMLQSWNADLDVRKAPSIQA